MPDTQPQPQPQPRPSPLLIFSGVFAAVLLISELMWLPRVSTVDTGGVERSIAELTSYQADLRAKVTAMEEQRNTLLVPVHEVVFQGSLAWKRAAVNAVTLLRSVEEVSSALPAEAEVLLEHVSVDAAAKRAELQGDIRGVGPSSMTVLAQFIQALKQLPFIASITPSPFVRLQDPGLGFHSPFTLSITFP